MNKKTIMIAYRDILIETRQYFAQKRLELQQKKKEIEKHVHYTTKIYGYQKICMDYFYGQVILIKLRFHLNLIE